MAIYASQIIGLKEKIFGQLDKIRSVMVIDLAKILPK